MSLTIYPITSTYKITTQDHGKIGILGDGSTSVPSFLSLHFVPDPTFVGGGITILGRQVLDDSAQTNFGTVAYRRVQLGGVASDYTLVQTTSAAVPLAADAMVQVPASGLSIAVLMDCTAGFAMLYLVPLVGHPGY